MTRENTRTLRVISYLLLGAAVVLQVLLSNGSTTTDISTGIVSLIAIAIALLLLAELGPFIRSLSAGGVNVEFAQDVSSGLNALEKRIGSIELLVEGFSGHVDVKTPALPAPAANLPVIDQQDPNKGRFGGAQSSGGFSLSATFSSFSSPEWVRVNLFVKGDPTTESLKAGEYVEFFLHDTFVPDVFRTPFIGNTSTLSVLAFGGFTVGAWIPSREVELELDLASIRKAPRIIREL
ncbi:hypothetical protein SAMN02745157_1927 [Kaistia soli DSM 19436]|uniref:Prokaryotic YEATS domain-containing protein n=1 Tax=Kaistia soli DSM 19436 TaxID=1122133 RepID=A0A1M4ZUQ1_9HYPH|nr:pYEATS domain-containing protein [Kaistia soli]SHF21701.1 hypothetical protein SAMN02745157_1927 [Kaistia soli DSM 19436]